VGSVDSSRVLVACSFASVGFFGNNESSTQTHGSLSLKQPYFKCLSTIPVFILKLSSVAEATLLTDNGSHWDVILLKSHFDPKNSRCHTLHRMQNWVADRGQKQGAIAKTVTRQLRTRTPDDFVPHSIWLPDLLPNLVFFGFIPTFLGVYTDFLHSFCTSSPKMRSVPDLQKINKSCKRWIKVV
jgi:hypothetical protein